MTARKSRDRQRPRTNRIPITQLLTNLAAQFGNNTLLEQNQYVLSMARTPWQNIFLTGDDMMTQPTEALRSSDMLPSNVSLVYSGYIETPQRRVAIINGIEYIEGELLDKSQLVIRHIDAPTRWCWAPRQTRYSAFHSWTTGAHRRHNPD